MPSSRPAPGAGMAAPGESGPLIRVYQVAPPAIQFLTALVEAADGVALVRTLDERRGLVECWIMPDHAADFEKLMQAVAQAYAVQEIGQEFE